MTVRGLAALAIALMACPSSRPEPAALHVAAAADLSHVFGALGPAFTAESGHQVLFTFAATGVLAKQLAEGAPYGVFASADTAAVDGAIAAGRCTAASRVHFATGRLAVVSAPGVEEIAQLAALTEARFKRIAIANPAHAPYGRAAVAALSTSGVMETVRAKLVYADNVAHALTLARSGNTEAAITSRALLIADGGERWLDVDERLHPALTQAMAVCSAHPAGPAFIAFVQRHPEFLRTAGFELPSEQAR